MAVEFRVSDAIAKVAQEQGFSCAQDVWGSWSMAFDTNLPNQRANVQIAIEADGEMVFLKDRGGLVLIERWTVINGEEACDTHVLAPNGEWIPV